MCMNNNIYGRIIRGIGGFYYVDTGKEIITCRARGKLRKLGKTPCVGDIAEVSLQNDGNGYLINICQRRNNMVRPPISNIDTIAIVASKAAPETDTFFIDRISVIAKKNNIDVMLIINKCDADFAKELYEIYTNVGIDVFRVSAINGEGIDALKEKLSGKLTAFTGNSGVGKSTLINALIPEAELKTGEINDKIGRGRHTTRQVEIIKLTGDTWIADTPGFSAFNIEQNDEITCQNLVEMFPEFVLHAEKCRFTGCSHIIDSGCEVINAVENGKIEKTRYESYKRLYEELNSIPKYK